jgi:hypothetical protein
MAQAGHTDPKMTLGIYAQVIASEADHGAALDGLVGGADWAVLGSKDAGRPVAAEDAADPRNAETAP